MRVSGILSQRPETFEANVQTHEWCSRLASQFNADIGTVMKSFLDGPQEQRDQVLAEITATKQDLFTLCKEIDAEETKRKETHNQAHASCELPIKRLLKSMQITLDDTIAACYQEYIKCVGLAGAASKKLEPQEVITLEPGSEHGLQILLNLSSDSMVSLTPDEDRPDDDFDIES